MPGLRPPRRHSRTMKKRRGPLGAAALLLALAVGGAAIALLWPGPGRGPFVEWLCSSSTTVTTVTAINSTPIDVQPATIPGWDGTAKNGREQSGNTEPGGAGRESAGVATTSTTIAASTPTRIVIPAIDVNAKVVSVGLLSSGAMQVPDFGLAGWYEPGPMPGEPGPAVVAAHVDSRSGPDVFYRLRDLQKGDEIRLVGENGVVVVFAVESQEQAPKSELPVDRIWNQTDEPVIRLITCGGEFDYSTRHYRDNIIVYGSFLRTGA